MKRGLLPQSLALALLATVLVQVGSPPPAFAGVSVSGRVFVDVTGNLLPGGEVIGDAANPIEAGVTVELWFDANGNNTLDAGDAQQASMNTDAAGAYNLSSAQNGDHWVVVDSRDINTSGGVAEQTYGPTGAICTNGDAPETQSTRGAAGACYGGRRGDTADDFDITGNAEHVSYLANGVAAANVDFGFSYNVVTRTSDANSQGTFRRFLNNANALGGPNAMRLVPAVPANASSGAHTWWRSDVAAALPVVSDAATTVDGLAYSLADGTSVVDSNDSDLGAFRTVGRTGAFSTPQLDPEFEVHGTNAIAYGLDIQADSATIRNISIWGFGDYLPAPVTAVIRVGVGPGSSFAAPTIERNVIGTAPGAFVDPGAGPRSGGHLISVLGVDAGTVEDNLFGFAGYNGIELEDDAGSWNILTNEIRSSGLSVGSGADRQGGVDMDGDASGTLIQGNLIIDTAADALENWRGPGGLTVMHNTIENTGQRGVENMAIRVFGTGTVVENNVFEGGSGPAIAVIGENSSAPWAASTGNRLSQNEYRNNAGNSIDLMAATTSALVIDNGDGISVNDAATSVSSGNLGTDYPVIISAFDGGASTTVTGTTCASCRVEVYEALAGAGDTSSGTDYGEGDRYLGFVVADGSGNWSFVDATVGVADVLSAIAIDGSDNTSEFSSNVAVTAPPVSAAGQVFEDLAGDAVKDGGDPGRGGVDVRLYVDDGDGVPDGGDTLVDSDVTAADGSYSLSGAVGDHWVVADAGDVTPSAGGAGVSEQTYGPAGALCTNGDSPETQTTRGTAGPCYGGRRGDLPDNFAIGTNAEHVALVNGATAGVDFGFSFNVVTRTSDANSQGTLRRFLNNAVGVTGANAMRFVPAVPTNDVEPGGDWWIVTLGSSLPVISGADTILDGTSYDLTDGSTVRDPNPGEGGNPDFPGKWVGTGANGVVEDGGDDPTLPSYFNPELEINGNDTGFVLEIGGTNVRVRRVSVYNSAPGVAGVSVSAGTGSALTESFIGPRADGSQPAAADYVDHGIEILGGAADVTDNFFAYTGDGAIFATNDSLIEGNDVYMAGLVGTAHDGISLEGSTLADTIIVRQNRFDRSSAYGLESWNAPGGWVVEDNTFSRSGEGVHVEGGGVRIFGTGSTVVHNRIENSRDAGLVLAERSAPGSNKFNLISQNSFSGNGTIAIDQDQTNIGAVNPNGDGITANSGAPATCGYTVARVNEGIDAPIVTSAIDAGATATVTGTGCPGATVEVYRAVPNGFTDNTDPVGGTGIDHGEGQTYLGSATADGSGNWTYVDAALNSSDVITALLFDGSNNTSEFSSNATVTAAQDITGKVFEDTVGDALNDGVINDPNNPGVGNVTVRIYRDGGDGLPDGVDDGAPVASTTTDPTPGPTLGDYAFPSVAPGTYWVIVDSTTVSPAAGVDPSYSAATPWAEQTYGPDQGWCADGTGGTAELSGAGTCYGGRSGATADNAATLAGGEHIARAVVGASGVASVDFGFSHNVVTNLQAAFAGTLDAPSYQGSLDQFLRNANAVAGGNALRFVPAVPTNASGGGGNWWRIDYTGTVAGQTPIISHDADTTIDGTAFDLADGITVLDTNSGYLGTNAGGGLTVGVDNLPLPQVEKPELELMRSDSGTGDAFPVDSNAVTGQVPDNFALRDMSIWGFAYGVHMVGVPAQRPSGISIDGNVIGSPPDGFSDPTVPGTLWTLYIRAADGGSLTNNLLGFVERDGVVIADTTGWAVSGNEILETAQLIAGADGLNDGAGSSGNMIVGNLIGDSGGMGIDGTSTGSVIQNNTITGSGVLGLQTAGIRKTDGPNSISRNVVTANAGPGVLIPDSDNGISVSENHFSGNGSIAIDLVVSGGSNDGGDGITLNDGGTIASTGNLGFDFPVIETATLSGGNLVVTGFARPGAQIEFYEALGAGDDQNAGGGAHGEGVDWLFTETEGSGTDADGSPGSYADPNYGADAAAERFSFTVAAPAGLAAGDEISAIGIDGAGNTSEFGPNAVVGFDISGTIFVDSLGDGLADGPIGIGPNAFEPGARIELFIDGGDDVPDGVDDIYQGFTTSSAVDGSYTFGGLAAGVYWVTVDSQGVDDGPYNGGYSGLDTWAEQTYGPVGAARLTGAVWSFAPAAGSFYGGAEWDVSDDFVPTNSLATAEHIARVDTGTGSAASIDFGFSFDVVTTTRGHDGIADPGAGAGQRSVQGSLRQFITNANAQSFPNTMRFVPAAPTNATDSGGNNWWRTDYTAALPSIDDPNTVIDGRAYDAADGATVRDDNSGSLGTGGTVGVAPVPLGQVERPELEIVNDRVTNPVAIGFDVQADDVTIQRLGIYGFGDVLGGNIRVGSGIGTNYTGTQIRNNIVGTKVDSFTDPGAATRSSHFNIIVRGGDTGTVADNLIGYGGNSGVLLQEQADGWTVTGNEVRGNAISSTNSDGVGTQGGGSDGHTFTGNLIAEQQGFGLEFNSSLGGHVVTNNTIFANGFGGTETGGINLYGTGSLIQGNVVSSNTGPGVLVQTFNAAFPGTPAVNNQITGNHFSANSGPSIDLLEFGSDRKLGDGITLNDGGPANLCGYNNTVGSEYGSEGLDYPTITSASWDGVNTTVAGTGCENATIEIYRAVAGAGDTDINGDDHGEGVEFIGSAPASPAGSFTFITAGLTSGDDVSAIAIDGSGNTSEFGLNLPVSDAQDISGKVFEDIAADVLNDGVINDGNNPGVGNVTVHLYRDGGDGVPDGADDGAPIASTTTDPTPGVTLGDFSFGALPNGTYWVVADSTTVAPAAGVNSPPVDDDDVWAEQTFAGAGGYDGTGFLAAAGPLYGGKTATGADDASGLTTAEHINRVILGGADAGNVDFGFSFNGVTNLEAGDASDADPVADRVFQGSLRQFILNANAVAGGNAMRFVPTVPTNGTDGGGNSWWRIDVSLDLPSIDDDATAIDGSAYDAADGASVVDTNTAAVGSNLTVGVGGLFTTPLLDPELEIKGDDVVLRGLTFTETADGAAVRHVAINRFAWWAIDLAGGAVDTIDSITVEDTVLGGASPADFSLDVASIMNSGVTGDNLTNSTIRNNVIGYLVGHGIHIDFGSSDNLVESNEVRAVNTGIYLKGSGAGQPARVTVRGNAFMEGSFWGIRTWNSAGDHVFTENTIRNGGRYGIDLYGPSYTVTGNVIANNAEDGIYVDTSVTGALLSRNRFGNNGQLAIDLLGGAGIDLNDDDDLDPGGNLVLNYPIIESAFIAGGNLTVTGFARPGVDIEFYEAVGAVNDQNTGGTPHGEGIDFLFAETEGSAGDADATPGSYSSLAYGSDTTAERFSFTIPVPAGLSVGEEMSSLAFDGSNNTSEFGPNATVVAAQDISGVVFEDTAGDVLNDGVVGDAANPGAPNVTVRAYRDGGNGVPDGSDVLVGTTTTGPAGSYAFTGLGPATYFVAVDSRTISPSTGVNASPADDDNVWAEQTYGPAGAYDGGFAAGAGAFVGGRNANLADDATTLTSAEHVARALVAGGPVANLDFGFSFNVVSNLEAGDGTDADPVADRVFQGSLRQFILNANAVTGANRLRFTPAVPTNTTDGGGNDWWRVDVTVVLPPINDPFTTIDGTAYDPADGATVVDSNSQTLGYIGPVGTGPDGLAGTADEAVLIGVLAPELEITGPQAFHGLELVTGADDFVLEKTSLWGFDSILTSTGIVRPTVRNNILGSGPGALADPGAGVRTWSSAIDPGSSADGLVETNFIGFTGGTAVSLDPVSPAGAGWTVRRNEIRDGATVRAVGTVWDGLQIGDTALVEENYIINSGGHGIDGWRSNGPAVIRENTVAGNGHGNGTPRQTAGIRLYGTGHVVERNLITGNVGPGISLTGDVPAWPDGSPAIQNRLSMNQFGANGGIAIDLVATGAAGDGEQGDGITLNDGATDPTHGNIARDYPALASATFSAGTTTVVGTACALCEVEVYLAVADGDFSDNTDPVAGTGIDHGEGVEYLGTTFADAAGSWSLATTVPSSGEFVTAITMDAVGNTSEFGANMIVGSPNLSTTKVPSLVGDGNGNGKVDPGDTVRFTISATNTGAGFLTGVTFTDLLADPEITLFDGTVTTSQGTIVTGNGAGDTTVVVDVGTLAPAALATITFDGQASTVAAPYVPSVSNQGTVASDQLPDTATDDPADVTSNSDPTVVALNHIPSLIDDSLTVDEDSGTTSVAIPGVLTNDTVNDGVASVTIASGPTNGLANIAVDGSYDYTPGAHYFGSDAFDYEVCDTDGDCVTATVNVTVDPVNDEPSFVPGGDVVVGEDSGAYSAPWAGSISVGPANEAAQVGAFAVTGNTDPTLFSVAPVVDGSGNLTFTPAGDANGFADVTIELRDDGGTANGGDDTSAPVVFRITVDPENDPPVAADITMPVSEYDPPGTILGTVPVVDIDVPPDTLTWSILSGNTDGAFDIDPANGDILVLDNTPLDYVVTSTYSLLVQVSDGAGGSDTATVTINVFGPRLATTLTDTLLIDSDGDSVPSSGDTLRYSVTINNTGNGGAPNATYTDLLTDASLGLVAGTVTTSQGSVVIGAGPSDSVVLVDLGVLAAAGTVTITYEASIADSLPPGVLQVATQGIISASGIAGLLTDDPDTLSTGDATVTPLTASTDVAAAKTASLEVDADLDGVISPGDTLRYLMALTNDGDADAGETLVSDLLIDPHLTLVPGSVTAPAGIVTVGNSPGDTNVNVALGTVPGNGGSATVEFDAIVANPLPVGVTSVTNQALVTGSNVPALLTDDPAVAGPSDATIVGVTASTELSATKTDSLISDADGDGQAAPGDVVEYTVVVTNSGSGDAPGVVFTDDLADPFLTLQAGSVTVSDGVVIVGNNPGDGVVEADLGVVAGAGGSATVTFAARIADVVDAGTLQVSNAGRLGAIVTDDPITPAPGDPTVTPLEIGPNLSITKTDGGIGAAPASTIIYTLSWANNGNRDEGGASLTETVPTDTSYNASLSSPGWTCPDESPGGTTCTLGIGPVGVGDGGSVVFAVDVAGSLPPATTAIWNIASIVGDGVGDPDTDLSDNDATLATALGDAVVQGTVWIDLDNDGAIDGGEVRLAGVDVRLTHVASSDVTTATTASDGTFVFAGLGSGDFVAGTEGATIPDGLAAGIPGIALLSAGAGSVDSGVISVTAGEVWNIDFPHIGLGYIGGTVWHDIDGDATISTGEPGVSGASLELLGSGFDGAFDTADDFLVETVSGADGSYLFPNLPADDYRIDVVAGGPVNAAMTGAGLPLLVGLAPGVSLDSVDIGFHEMADLGVNVRTFDAPNPGAEITYLFTVTNSGPATSGPVSLTVLLPGGFAYDGSSGTGWDCTIANELSCIGGSLGVGATTTVSVTGTVIASEGVTLSVLGAVSSPTPDTNLANNQAAYAAGVGQLSQTGLSADALGLTGVLLLLLGALLLAWAWTADRRRRRDRLA